MQLYRGSDDRFYTDHGVWWRIETGEWTVEQWSEVDGEETVETDDGERVVLSPVGLEDLPRFVELQPDTDGYIAVDLRERPA
jgi:hypothetical protein